MAPWCRRPRAEGADPRYADAEGVPLLVNAAENRTLAVMKLLAESDGAKRDGEAKGEYLDVVSTKGFTALIIELAHGHLGTIEYLLKDTRAEMNAMHEIHATLLMYAAASGHIGTMKLLLGIIGVDVNEIHNNSGSLLWRLPWVGRERQ